MSQEGIKGRIVSPSHSQHSWVWRLGSLEFLHGAPQLIPSHQVLLFSYLHKKAAPALSICHLPFGGHQHREGEYTMSTHYVSQQNPGFYRSPFQHKTKNTLFLYALILSFLPPSTEFLRESQHSYITAESN